MYADAKSIKGCAVCGMFTMCGSSDWKGNLYKKEFISLDFLL